MPNWQLVADNYQACLDAMKLGYPFSLCMEHPGPYSDTWNDMADRYMDRYIDD